MIKNVLRERIGQRAAFRLSDGTIVRGLIQSVVDGAVVLVQMREVTSYTLTGVTDGLNWTTTPQLVPIDSIARAWQPPWA